MSLPPQVNTDKGGKHRAAAMKETVQHSGEVYYGMAPPTLESSHSDSASSSGVYNPEKGPQSLPHYQQAAPVKWIPQDSIQASNWSQEGPVPAWGQNFGPYMGGVNVRSQMAFHKGVHEGVALPMGGENQLPGPVEVYRETNQAQSQGRGLEWEQHAVAAMHQAQLQAYQHGHKSVELQGQSHVQPHSLQGSMLQPFQTTYRPNKQQFSSGYYSVFPGNKAMPSLAYSEQPKAQQLLHQLQQQQQQQQQQQKMHHHHQQQQQQQQQLQQQHHIQLQQQQQHLQQQQIQQHQMQQQQLQQMQQYHQQQLQERQQQMQQMQQQQMQQQNVPQQDATQLQVQPKQQQTQNFAAYQSPDSCPPDLVSKKENVQSVELQSQTCDTSAVHEPCAEKFASDPAETLDSQAAAPRRSRRLSREGQSPLGPPTTNNWCQGSKEPLLSQNGVAAAQRGEESQVTTGGVIQISRRRRRASKEINLETLAQTASERQKIIKEDSSGRQSTMVPLVIPVSVPVHKSQTDRQEGWAAGRLGLSERPAGQADRKPSVIVARRRSLRNPMSESFGQDGENDPGLDEDGKPKFKRRPRPEPLIIPPPKPSTFIPPSIYSSITSYQSNLRSPVRMPDNPLTLPPYTPPPILSPVREGSGLYFSTLMTNMAVGNQILPPPATPKSAARSLLRSTSSEITPPVLPLISDVTPVSLEPRINIGQHYQAEIPLLQDQVSSQFDQHKADMVWAPVENMHLKNGDQKSMDDLMNMACSSVLRGGGTNQELVLHSLHECGGDFLETLGRLMLQDPLYPKGHHLADYHYSGSDRWTAEEKRYFNKGISAYRKDFFMVQKLVRTKTVAQCVEFYYTYKKQVKIGRNGILTFGPPDSPVEKHTEAVVDVKSSQQSKLTVGETDRDNKMEISYDQISESGQQARVAQSLQAHDYAGTVLVIKEPEMVNREAHLPSAPHRLQAEAAAKKSRAPTKPPQDPDAVFPCKKCGRVFYKVKSRSAHMKSHAEQEKKAAALRQREEEEHAAAQARARKAAAAAAAAAVAAAAVAAAAAGHQGGNGNGLTEQAEVSSHEESSEGEDDDDEDWH